jgi:hypothetical protein
MNSINTSLIKRVSGKFHSLAPSPLAGEGWGEGDFECYTPSLTLSHQGRGGSLNNKLLAVS